MIEKSTIYLYNKWTSHENKEVEPVQMNIYQSNIYREDLSWLDFDSELRVQEG